MLPQVLAPCPYYPFNIYVFGFLIESVPFRFFADRTTKDCHFSEGNVDSTSLLIYLHRIIYSVIYTNAQKAPNQN